MYATQTPKSVKIDKKDLKTFKNLIFPFIIFKCLAILTYLFRPLISAILYDLGTLFLLIGVYTLYRNNKQLSASLKVVLVFSLAMITALVVAELNNLYPHSSHISTTIESLHDQLVGIENGFGQHVFLIVSLTIINGILMLIAAYFFTDWINLFLNTKKKFRIYFYFGILSFVGELITGLALALFARELPNAINGPSTTTAIAKTLAFSGLFTFVGLVVRLIAFAVEIIAGIVIYTNINSSLSIPETIHPVQAQGGIYCANCGVKIEENAKLCYNCGMPIQRA